MLAEPFFWPKDAWIECPDDFKLNTVQGKGYDSEVATGRDLWNLVSERLQLYGAKQLEAGTAAVAAIESKGYGKPQIVLPRLGQELFRVLVTDAYQKRCAITGERTLPVLDAAHIKPYKAIQKHEASNGLLMRSDLHRLFDNGNLAIDHMEHRMLVSKRIKEEFENGRKYYRLEGVRIRDPLEAWAKPGAENLEYHANEVFR